MKEDTLSFGYVRGHDSRRTIFWICKRSSKQTHYLVDMQEIIKADILSFGYVRGHDSRHTIFWICKRSSKQTHYLVDM